MALHVDELVSSLDQNEASHPSLGGSMVQMFMLPNVDEALTGG